jgi:hypothetical protein
VGEWGWGGCAKLKRDKRRLIFSCFFLFQWEEKRQRVGRACKTEVGVKYSNSFLYFYFYLLFILFFFFWVSSSGKGSSSVCHGVMTQLLTEMDGFVDLKNVILIAATNRPDKIDPVSSSDPALHKQ